MFNLSYFFKSLKSIYNPQSNVKFISINKEYRLLVVKLNVRSIILISHFFLSTIRVNYKITIINLCITKPYRS